LGTTGPIPSSAGTNTIGVVEAFRRASRWARSEEARLAASDVVADVAAGAWSVTSSIRLPTRQGLIDFFTHQVLVNMVGWMTGLATAHVVTRLFEVRGFRNLWGLAASDSRTLVSADDHRLITTLTGFTVGLLMMLFVRHFLMRWISETRAIRADRRGSRQPDTEDRPLPLCPPVTQLDDLELARD